MKMGILNSRQSYLGRVLDQGIAGRRHTLLLGSLLAALLEER